MSDKQHDDALMDAYRRASASDADRPSAATRAAILAEAAAAARRNAPAANEPRYWPRAVAGIAVLGIGLLLWRQTDYRLPDDPAAVVVAPLERDTVAGSESAPLPENPPEPGRAAVEERAADSVRAETVVVNDPPLPQPFPAPAATSPPSPPPKVESSRSAIARNTDDEELEEISVTGTRIQVPNDTRVEAAPAAPPQVGGAARAGADALAAVAPQALDSAALLRQHFPAQYQSDVPHSLWLVLNAAGEVLQRGELATGQRLADLTPQLTGAFGGRAPGPWQVQNLRNARGQPIELGIARLP